MGLVWVGAGLCSCARESGKETATPPREPGPLRVVATIAPLGALLREVLPEGAQLRVLLTPGQSEHGYEPTPQDIASLARADLAVYVGLGLDARVEEFLRKNPSSRRVDLCVAVALGLESAEHGPGGGEEPGDEHAGHEHVDHDHEPNAVDDHDGHTHGPIDPHLWLDPMLMKSLVGPLGAAVEQAARAAGPMSAEEATRLGVLRDSLVRKLDELDAEYRSVLTPLSGRSIVTHHNAWGRLASRYGLKVAAVLRPVEATESAPADISRAVEAMRASGASAIFVEPQFNSESARRVAQAAGVKVLVLDPLGGEDYFAMMKANLGALRAGLAHD